MDTLTKDLNDTVTYHINRHRKIAKQLKEEGKQDDRQLFVRIFASVEELEQEEPKTAAGKRAINQAIVSYLRELNELYFSLKERKMI